MISLSAESGSARSSLLQRLIDTRDLALDTRFDQWMHAVAQLFGPMKMRGAPPPAFNGQVDLINLGKMYVATFNAPETDCERTRQSIRLGDPELLHLALSCNASTVVEQDRRSSAVGPSDLVFYCSSQPYRVRARAPRGPVRGIMVGFPRALITLPPRKVERMTGTAFPGTSGAGGLLANYLRGLVNLRENYRTADTGPLASILVDMLNMLLVHATENDQAIAADSHQRLMMLQIRDFVESHLDDVDLSPSQVAAAHHISLRHLYRVFAEQELGLAGFIRARRLERCQRDLADPQLLHVSIATIARRYGFTSASHFSRGFRAEYGMSPRDYRHATLSQRRSLA